MSTILFEDNFDTDGEPTKWFRETMHTGDHRAGNSGQDRDGNEESGKSVRGKRWSMWYDDYTAQTASIHAGTLSLASHVVHENDPTRVNFLTGNSGRSDELSDEMPILHPYHEVRLYSSFLTTWARKWSNEANAQVVDPASPNITFGPNVRISIRINFENMQVIGHRVSLWAMPANVANVGVAYDGDIANGVEIDVFEYDPAMPNMLCCKCLGGAAGSTAGGVIDCSHLNIATGWHIIELDWTPTEIRWSVDGEMIQVEKDLIPTAPHYLLLTREGNSGVHTAQAKPPKKPADPGLFGRSVILDILGDKPDVAQVDFVRVTALSDTEEPTPPEPTPPEPTPPEPTSPEPTPPEPTPPEPTPPEPTPPEPEEPNLIVPPWDKRQLKMKAAHKVLLTSLAQAKRMRDAWQAQYAELLATLRQVEAELGSLPTLQGKPDKKPALKKNTTPTIVQDATGVTINFEMEEAGFARVIYGTEDSLDQHISVDIHHDSPEVSLHLQDLLWEEPYRAKVQALYNGRWLDLGDTLSFSN